MTVGSRARTQMTMRAAIERNATSTIDVDGHPQAPSWGALATIPCRVYSRRRRDIVDGRKSEAHEELFCAVALDADVTEADRIATVQDRLGATLFTGPFSIETIQNKVSHKQFKLQVISS